jgi:hypothetical protein
MIDGVKIECNYLPSEKWPQNELLLFKRLFFERTGEIPPDTRHAVYNGLKFKITPSQNHPEKQYQNIEGSLHRYFNKGGTNANDYSFAQLKDTIEDLAASFDIDPEKSILRNLEFGINIELPIKADQFLKYIISTPTKRFTDLSINKLKVGKVCAKHEYLLKIYNKGKQEGSPIDNLIRLEIKVKKMRYIQTKCNIITLADLLKLSNIQCLGGILIESISNLIIYDNSIRFESLTDREKIQLSNFRNPMYWECMNYRQRNKKNNQFKTLLKKHKANDIHQNLINMVKTKWYQLTINFDEPETGTPPQAIEHQIQPKFKTIPADKKGMFSPLEWKVKTPLNTLQKLPIKESENNLPEILKNCPEKRFCPICGRDISQQKTSSIYCSEKLHGKKCRNRATQIRRTERNQQKRQIEAEKLPIALALIRGTNKAIIYSTTDKKHKMARPTAIKDKPPKSRTVVYVFAAGYEFTSLRAKEFIKSIIKYQSNENPTAKRKAVH